MNAEMCREDEVRLEKRDLDLVEVSSGRKNETCVEAQEHPNCCSLGRTGRQVD